MTSDTTVEKKIFCYHCGEKIINPVYIEKQDNEKKYFCCNGCLQAYKLIQNLGFQKYYETRTELPDKPDENYLEESIYHLIDEQISVQKDKSGQIFKEGKFYIKGLHCASCVWVNEKVLYSIEGVLEAYVQLSTNRVYLKWDPQKVNLSTLAKSTAQIGYPILPVDESREEKLINQSDILLKKMAIAGFFMGNNMMISVSLYAGYLDYIEMNIKQYFHWISFLLTTPVIFYSASDFFKSGYYSLKNKVLGTDLLTAVGLTLAYVYSIYITFLYKVDKEVFFDAISFVVFAILLGRFIESRIKLKTLYFTHNLTSQKPSYVRVLKNYNLVQMVNNKFFINDSNKTLDENKDYEFKKVEDVKENEIIVVPIGELVPLDSALLNLSAELDEASITGEFKPVLKKYNDFIVSGSKNVNNSFLYLKVLKKNEESTIFKILKMAEESLKQKSNAETLGNKVSGIFVGLVLFLGFLTFAYWYFYKNDLSSAVLFTLSLLIVACPCALSLSIPTAIIVGLQKSFSMGCLIHNTSLFETIVKSKIICFDKTGTLTKGNLKIEKILTSYNKENIYELIKKINDANRELKLQHPITLALYQWEEQKLDTQFYFFQNSLENLQMFFIVESRFYPGLGVEYILENNQRMFLGSQSWLESMGFLIPSFDEHIESGNIIVCIGIESQNKQILSILILKDEIKSNAREVIHILNSKYKTILLTGDKKENAAYLQKITNIKEIYYSLKPKDKSEIIKKFQKNYNVVMVGDGINDTIALKQADAGISFADASKLALYSADILLINNDLKYLIYFLVVFLCSELFFFFLLKKKLKAKTT